MSCRQQVGITSSQYVSEICDLLPSNEGRQSLVSSLICSYNLLHYCTIIPIQRASRLQLEKFHSDDFVTALLERRTDIDKASPKYNNLLSHRKTNFFKDRPQRQSKLEPSIDINKFGDEIAKKVEESSEDEWESDKDSSLDSGDSDSNPLNEYNLDTYGLQYDCYVFPFMADYVSLVAGSTISTAEYLIYQHRIGNKSSVGINWYGGRHHCTKNMASGFCYVNDIVLGINKLRMYFPTVFYIDMDLHHGDGVESAFKFSNKVVTCSMHRYDVGFYPGTGKDTVKSKVINIPTRKGLGDNSLLFLVERIILPAISGYKPSVIVLQLGADGLALDEHKQWNLTIKGFAAAVKLLLENCGDIPVMVLGGGGYNHTETAKCWTYITKIILESSLDKEITMEEAYINIPEHDFLDSYCDDGYKFWTESNSTPSKMKDTNDMEYLETLQNNILKEFL
ncbi:histone deacetylase Hos1p [[Candida] anglica]|uniref:Histone deacetylase Hos1p n=1 Tax=[Candida] anglica TaxID=148631 RepID=A0ABP0EDM5_9ASCO